MRNSIEFEAAAEFALFTDPIIGAGGGRCTLPVPTYGALRGLCSAIYYAPSLEWIVDAVRIMNPVRTEPLPVSAMYSGGPKLNCCLRNVRYRVKAHFVRAEGISGAEYMPPRHYSMAVRALSRGGRRETYLGTRSCSCDVRAYSFDEGTGCYDDVSQELGLMYHSLEHRSDGNVYARLFCCRMENGIIRFPVPSSCVSCRTVTENKQYALV